jgi:perosamine synthetase
MSSMQAALGLAQLERIEELLERKRRISKCYQEELNGVEGIILNHATADTNPVYWMVTVVLDQNGGLMKENLLEKMSERDIDCRPFFHPLSSLPAYRNTEQARLARARNRVSYRVSPYGLNLPSGLNMTAEKIRVVCGALREILRLNMTVSCGVGTS